MRRAAMVASVWAVGALAWAGMPPVPVEVAQAARGTVRETLPTVGTVRPLREVKIASKIAERVDKLLVDDGDPVKAGKDGQPGQLICQLDVTDTKLAMAEAKARLEDAEAALAKAKAGLRENEIKQARALEEEQQARVKKLNQDVERVTKLFEKRIISDSERDATVAQYETAVAKLHGAEAARRLAEEGTRKEDIARAQAEVDLRKAEVATLDQQLQDATITSPVTGYVVRKHIEEGEWIQIGGTVVDVIDTSILRVHTRVSEMKIRQIKEGQKAVVRLDAHPGRTFEGTVHRVIPEADDASRSFPVQVDVADPEGLAKPGMFARVGFILAERQGVLEVPEDALVLSGGLKAVYKAVPMPPPPPGAAQGGPPPDAKGGPPGGPPGGMPPMPGPIYLASRVIVRTGARQEGMIEIAEVVNGTLSPGDLVVVTGSENLQDNSAIIVVRGLPAGAAGQGKPVAEAEGTKEAGKP